MVYNYFHIRYFETIDGNTEKTASAFYYTPYPSTIDTLKFFLANSILKNPDALVTIFSLQPIDRERYLFLGGTAPAD